MHVTRAITVSFQLDEQLSDWSVGWNWIGNWHDGFEPESAVLITTQDCTLVWPVSPRVLHIIETLAVCFPNVNLDALDRLAVGVSDVAYYKAVLAFRIVCDERTVLGDGGFVRMEGPKNSTFGACRGFRVVDAVD